MNRRLLSGEALISSIHSVPMPNVFNLSSNRAQNYVFAFNLITYSIIVMISITSTVSSVFCVLCHDLISERYMELIASCSDHSDTSNRTFHNFKASKLLDPIQFVDRRISRICNCEMFGQVSGYRGNERICFIFMAIRRGIPQQTLDNNLALLLIK